MQSKQNFKYVHKTVTRHGRIAYYYWRRPGPKVRIRSDYGSAEFRREVDAIYEHYPKLPGSGFSATLDGLLQAKKTRRRNKPATTSRKHKIAFALEKAVLRARNRAKRDGLEFDLDYEWAITRAMDNDFRCEMTDIPFFDDYGEGGRVHPFLPTIDRVDNGAGYTKINSRVVCYAFNIGRLDWGIDVFERVIDGFKKKTKALSR